MCSCVVHQQHEDIFQMDTKKNNQYLVYYTVPTQFQSTQTSIHILTLSFCYNDSLYFKPVFLLAGFIFNRIGFPSVKLVIVLN